MDGQRIVPAAAFRTKCYLYALITLILLAPGVLFGLAPGMGWLYVLIYVLSNLLWVVPTAVLIPLYVRSISYELGEDEIVVRKGIITQTVQTVPYHMVHNVDVRRGPLDRLLGIGSIQVHTAGYSQQATAEARLAGLRDLEPVQAALLAAIRRHRAPAAAAPAPAVLAEGGEAVWAEMLAELRAIREQLAAGGRG